MAGRTSQFASNWSDLVFPFPRNWTAIGFFGLLGALHLCNAAASFWAGQFEAYLSVAFGLVFAGVALGWRMTRSELGVLSSERRLRLRTRLGRVATERSIPFDRVRGVRLMATGSESDDGCRVEILCESEDIECPPTPVARQQALCLAMMMGVRLIRVGGDDRGPERYGAVPQEQPN